MKISKTTLAALFALSMSMSSAQASGLIMPTFELQCITSDQQATQALVLVDVTRLSSFSDMTAVLTYFHSDDGKGAGYVSNLEMSGKAKDARSQLFIDLNPKIMGTLPADIANLYLDLSYEFSTSKLTLNDGTIYTLHCKARDYR